MAEREGCDANARDRRSFWGWGTERAALGEEERARLHALLASRLDLGGTAPIRPPRLDEIALRSPRVTAPPALRGFVTDDRYERAAHTYGKSFRDVVRGLARDFGPAPDAVAFPATEPEIEEVLAWCGSAGIAVIPYGGGSSVVGGVEARVGPRWNGAVSLDLRRLSQVVEIDRTSRAARVQCGILGPALEEALRPHGLTLRHFPQSFEFSTLGGWIATRAGGHYATLHTRIDDFVQALRVLTPGGPIETRRVPASGAGPAPERLFLGSEGALGLITEAWMRLQERPRFRASASARFAEYGAAAEAVRALAQSGLHPSNCRLLDAGEALQGGVGDGSLHVLLIGFESSDHPPDAAMRRALELVRGCGGAVREGAGATRATPDPAPDDPSAAWRAEFLRAPYLRDALATLGLVVETFETAITWDRFLPFHDCVRATVEDALRRICGGGAVTSRITHAYADGAAPYYTVVAPARPGSQLAQWDEVKAAASEAILANGGTITHHHAVGRDHQPWYERERPARFGDVLRAAKAVLDPAGILNPGVLVAE